MQMETTILAAIGDLHGHYPALAALLSALERRGGFFERPGRLAPGAELVFTGDYIDRGTGALSIIERLRELQNRNPGQVITLLGNHELMALEHLDEARRLAAGYADDGLARYGDTAHGWNGGSDFVREFHEPDGRTALRAYADRMDRKGDVGRWIRSLGPLYETFFGGKRFLFTHGDVPEALLAPRAVEKYGREVTLRMNMGSDDLGGAVVKYGDRIFTSSAGSIFWCREFRKLVGAAPTAIASICERAGVDYIVTGHTMHPGKIVAYGGRIFDIDVGMTPAQGGNPPQALLVTSEGITAFGANGRDRMLASFDREPLAVPGVARG